MSKGDRKEETLKTGKATWGRILTVWLGDLGFHIIILSNQTSNLRLQENENMLLIVELSSFERKYICLSSS